MTEMTRREWLLTEQPASRRQARLGQGYRTWLALRSNRLAMVGLFIIMALIGVAVFANLLAPYDPPSGRQPAHRTPAAAVLGASVRHR